VLVTVAVVVVVVVVAGHRTPTLTSAGGAPPKTGVVLLEAADPQGGPPWGLELVKVSGGQVCPQVGRVEGGRLGAIGQYGAYHNDGRFHPVRGHHHGGVSDTCTPPDAHGNVFATALAPNVPASAAGFQQRGTAPADRRTMEYGLFGPDVVSITYVSATGRLVTKPTGPGGSYLIVLPNTHQICRPGTRPCIVLKAEAGYGGVISGLITTVTYRNGSTCHLVDALTSMCPAKGRVFPPIKSLVPTVPRARVATRVTAQVLPAGYYCQPRSVRIGGWIPCDHGTPPGYARTPGTPGSGTIHQELVHISFTARLAGDNHHSYYEMAYTTPCGGRGQGGGNSTQTTIRAGQHITEQLFASARCHGRYTGLITYQPHGSALGQRNGLPPGDGSTLVGQFSFTIP
jgi:hypothetical protein